MASSLFSPLKLRDATLANRIVVAPMCQYSAEGGLAGDWHLAHYGQLALGGLGLVIAEAVAVAPEGRITPGCLGLYSDQAEAALARVTAFCRRYGNSLMGVQLSHSGRKGSCAVPWEGGAPLAPGPGGWPTVAPSALSFTSAHPVPAALDAAGLERLRAAFAAAAGRAIRIGFEVIEVHAAHGYLLNEFLSPLANRREDAYGGSLANRMRFPLEVFRAVRAAVPPGNAAGVRVSAVDWAPGGWEMEDSIAFTKALEQEGCDFLHVSSGGMTADAEISGGPGYQVAFAAALKRETAMAVIAVGNIGSPAQAETIVRSGQADLVALGRGLLDDPRWAWHAAAALGAEAAYPPQYARSHPRFRDLAVPGKPPAR